MLPRCISSVGSVFGYDSTAQRDVYGICPSLSPAFTCKLNKERRVSEPFLFLPWLRETKASRQAGRQAGRQGNCENEQCSTGYNEKHGEIPF
jgi:hypothetical protein